MTNGRPTPVQTRVTAMLAVASATPERKRGGGQAPPAGAAPVCEGGGDAGQESPAAATNQDDVRPAAIVEDLEAQRGVAGHQIGVVEAVEKSHAGFLHA